MGIIAFSEGIVGACDRLRGASVGEFLNALNVLGEVLAPSTIEALRAADQSEPISDVLFRNFRNSVALKCRVECNATMRRVLTRKEDLNAV